MQIGRRALIVGAGLASIAAVPPMAVVGQSAPAFDVFTFDWKKVHFKELQGRVVLLNFWASWCAPCRVELPEIDAYARRHAGAPLSIFAVRSDDEAPNSFFIDLAKRLAFPLVWHLDGNGYGAINGAVPTNYVIDRQGVVRYAKPGAFSVEGLEQVVTPLLTAAAGTVTTAADYQPGPAQRRRPSDDPGNVAVRNEDMNPQAASGS
jgi:cytochrome c biogenesis protein CcmG/thiol:disulfide interchange protein DsbE